MNSLTGFASRCALLALLLLTAKNSLAADPPAPLKALLVLGGCCHDYKTQQDLLVNGLAERAHVKVSVAYDPDTTNGHLNPVYQNPDWAAEYDVIIHDECSSNVKDLSIIDRILAPHRAGLPAVLLHCGMHSYRSEGYPEAVTPWFEFTGLQSTGHGPQAPIDIVFETAENPITGGFANWTTINEELYNNSSGKLLETATALARGRQTTRSKQGNERTNDYVVAWTNNYRGAKVFATTLGHNNQTVADPRYLDLVTRGLLWSCGKLNESYLKNSSP
jgi:type 1 glutamine amidotransferase